MRTVFGGWKYIIRNIWYVLSLAVLPAVFLSLSIDANAVGSVVRAYFTGDPRMGFVECLRAWSFIRFDSLLGGFYSLCAYFVCSVFMALLLTLVEKHLRIGKRTLSGVWTQFLYLLPSVLLAGALYVAIYEIWAVVLSAVLFVVSALPIVAMVYILGILVMGGAIYLLLYLVTVAYLFLPCKQNTGFRIYDSFLYSYRLMTRVRGKLILSMLLSYAVLFAATCASSLLPVLYRILSIVIFALLFLSFGVRMETAYFDADKLDREDLLKSYREL